MWQAESIGFPDEMLDYQTRKSNRLMKPFLSIGVATLSLVLPFSSCTSTAAVITFQQGVNPSGSYTGGASTYIRSGTSATVNNNGASTNLIIGAVPAAGNPLIRGLFSYDLSLIPAGATINSVTASLTPYQADGSSLNANFTLNLQQLSTPFVESQATWNNAATSTLWTTPGGDFSGTALSSIVLNPVTLTPNVTRTFNSSAGFVSAVQSSLDASQPFQFIVKMANESPGGRAVFFFVDDENSGAIGTSAMRPSLTVDYTPVPEPNPVGMVLCGLVCLCALSRRYSGQRSVSSRM